MHNNFYLYYSIIENNVGSDAWLNIPWFNFLLELFNKLYEVIFSYVNTRSYPSRLYKYHYIC